MATITRGEILKRNIKWKYRDIRKKKQMWLIEYRGRRGEIEEGSECKGNIYHDESKDSKVSSILSLIVFIVNLSDDR